MTKTLEDIQRDPELGPQLERLEQALVRLLYSWYLNRKTAGVIDILQPADSGEHDSRS